MPSPLPSRLTYALGEGDTSLRAGFGDCDAMIGAVLFEKHMRPQER